MADKNRLRITGGDITNLIERDRVEFLGHVEINGNLSQNDGSREIMILIDGEHFGFRMDDGDHSRQVHPNLPLISYLSECFDKKRILGSSLFLAEARFNHNYIRDGSLYGNCAVIGFGDLYKKKSSRKAEEKK